MIYGERIRFRHIEREDLPSFAQWINDPEVREGIGPYLPMSMPNQEKWFEEMLNRPLDEQWFALEVREGEGWQMIGNCGFFGADHRVRSMEVGIMIGDKGKWGQGYGTETMLLLNKVGFDTLNLHRIFLRVNENNPGAVRCYEKAGYVHELRQRQAALADGEYIDLLYMGILRDEWLRDKISQSN
ncbi:MAG: GNAT family N-acetyltransferase [Chloroflexi bacterium]|nr:GNAT family N-acetyltransferase [Chloroflexota bacterium]